MTTPTTPSGTPTNAQSQRLPLSFWCMNTIEMFERLAFYTLRVMAPIYIMQADNPGGLHLTAGHKGTIYAVWAAVQSLLPMFTGGFADRYGYKRTLFFSFTLMTSGLLIVALARDIPGISNYAAFFTGIIVLATGTAFFKPGIQGSIAHTLPKEKSSVGWSIFYWVVNIGAFVGHFLPALFLPSKLSEQTPEAWRNLFLCAAGFSSLNFLMLLTFKDVPSGASKTDGPLTVFWRTITNLFEARLLAWLAIMSGFWMMMYQLWDLQPNFITDWIDSRPVAESLSFLPTPIYDALTVQSSAGRMIPQNVILSINSACIILGVVGMGWLTRRMRTLTAMLWGMIAAAIGVLIAGLTMNPWMLFAGIVCFSLGEMTTGPKKSEYLALIAPPGKKGLYLGYVNIPVGIGVFAGSKLAGWVYGSYGEKAVLALKHLDSIGVRHEGAALPASATSLEKAVGIARPEAFDALVKALNTTPDAATRLLWETYSPQYPVWVPFACIGLVCAVALYVFGRMARRWSDMNA